ncbi:glycerophosphocholine cholinephosphodiesterase ENPP6 [Patella vulgata]|uniref:glycerophosphocholine cholinephosphodiesterase ENPP6 n=1 Tax=Patella vulgata TaxID=6465 RepID=UPI0024A840A8|nr:glycerophosphocholine cholinephosphodiesterase ENPP6 [Patella vulgata]XP_050404395.2 glycerophosphocholine cholinephosphodiesterase ENPP6 [Patella vulgata]
MVILIYLQHLTILVAASLLTISGAGGHKLMVFLLDGVRWDYLDRDSANLPGFKRIKERGVKVESLVPEFPSVSYPNHYSLMTGLHCENHGFVDNDMYDVNTGKYYPPKSGKEEDKSLWFEEGEPVWITATKEGKSSYMYNWVGGDVEIHGTRPDYFRPYSPVKKLKYFRRDIDQGLDSLMNGTADLVGIYHEGVDDMGHRYGPDSTEVYDWLKNVDAEFDRLLTKMTDLGVENDINIMIFSDHGMTDVSLTRVINITSLLPMDKIDAVINGYGSRISIWPKEESRMEIYKLLKNYDRHMTVYLKGDIPSRWYYTNNSRIAPLLLVADLGWYIDTPGFGFYKYDTGIMKGEHGFDPELKDMHGMFLAMGPNFLENYESESIRNIDLYQMMCKILDIEVLPNNGTWLNVEHFFLSSGNTRTISLTTILLGLATLSIY